MWRYAVCDTCMTHTTPVLKQLHWLSVRQRVAFQLAVLVYKASAKQPGINLSDDCQLVATRGRRQLRSSDNFKCPRNATVLRLGDGAFAAARQCLWNSLPTHVRRHELYLDTFRRKLKSYLTLRGTNTQWLLLFGVMYKVFYLLT